MTAAVASSGRSSLSCPSCHGANIEFDASQGSSVCVDCGTVLEENVVVSEVTFAELSTGASVLQGQFISSERGKSSAPSIFGRRMDAGESREATIALGKRRIQEVAVAVGGLAGEHFVETAHRWYILALQHQFTRGRRAGNIVAACLYIVCRQEKTPHMLLDFADVLQTSVYSLGGTFLRLVRLLNLEIPIIDPSFYVGRFAARLEFAEKTQTVANTALRLVARMKRDWIQTGRRPAGVCAAGLIIAARMHGFRRTDAEIVRVVRICEATLRKRLEEFDKTDSANLTPEQFEGLWLEKESDPPSFTKNRAAETRKTETKEKAKTAEEEEKEEELEEMLPLTPPASQPIPEFELKPYEAPDEATFSDLDEDEEVSEVLLDAGEIELKTRIWSSLNEDYLKQEAEKAKIAELEAKTQASKPGQEQEGAEQNAASVAVPKKRGPRGPRQTTKVAKGSSGDGAVPASTAAEAAKQTLSMKRLSKKINYDALDSLFQR